MKSHWIFSLIIAGILLSANFPIDSYAAADAASEKAKAVAKTSISELNALIQAAVKQHAGSTRPGEQRALATLIRNLLQQRKDALLDLFTSSPREVAAAGLPASVRKQIPQDAQALRRLKKYRAHLVDVRLTFCNNFRRLFIHCKDLKTLTISAPPLRLGGQASGQPLTEIGRI